MSKRTQIILITVISLLLLIVIVIPLLFYAGKFAGNGLSRDKGDWGTFGDFIGGTTNTLISLISAGILVYITIVVAKNSSQEAFKQQILLRRMDAVKSLQEKFINLGQESEELQLTLSRYSKFKAHKIAPEEALSKLIDAVQKQVSASYSHKIALNTFPISYGMLFKYDFMGEEYTQLRNIADTIHTKLSKYFANLEAEIEEQDDKHISELTTSLARVMEKLLAECENNII